MTDSPHMHCGHDTLVNSTHKGSTGTNEVRCCHCGEKTIVPWRIGLHTPEGHGAYATYSYTIETWPEGWQNQFGKTGVVS